MNSIHIFTYLFYHVEDDYNHGFADFSLRFYQFLLHVFEFLSIPGDVALYR